MSSRLNSEFNYRFQIEGYTPWAKLFHLKSFRESRLAARALKEVARMKIEAKELEVRWNKDNGIDFKALEIQAEIMEMNSSYDDAMESYRLNEKEIACLDKLIAETYLICEPTRLDDHDDDDMFELNEANDFTMMIAREIQAEMIATGRPSPASVGKALSNPHTMKALIEIGLLPEGVPYLSSTDPHSIHISQIEVDHNDVLRTIK